MNIVLSSTGFTEPNHSLIPVSKDNLAPMELDFVDTVDNIVIHRCFHLLEVNKVIELIERYYRKIVEGGKLTVFCIDVYTLGHKIHRREIGEGDFNTCMYEAGQKNCVSTLFIIENCNRVGFKTDGVSFNGLWAKLEFIK